jgi:hypothetical protein
MAMGLVLLFLDMHTMVVVPAAVFQIAVGYLEPTILVVVAVDAPTALLGAILVALVALAWYISQLANQLLLVLLPRLVYLTQALVRQRIHQEPLHRDLESIRTARLPQ